MLQFLLALHFVLTVSIIGLIMLQKHDSDGALGSSGGGAASSMFSVRGQANVLTKTTAILMTIFMVNCLVMAKITKRAPIQGSVIDAVADNYEPITKSENTIPVEAPANTDTLVSQEKTEQSQPIPNDGNTQNEI